MALDRFGTDIWHIVDTEGAGGAGHSAMIVGNPTDGYDFYSYGPTVGEPHLDNVAVTHRHADTLEQLVGSLQADRVADGLSQYDKWQKWETDSETDNNAREGAMEFDGTDYDLTMHNCWLMVRRALDRAQIIVNPDDTNIPNRNFEKQLPEYGGTSTDHGYNDPSLGVLPE